VREPTRKSRLDVESPPPPATDGLGRLDQARALSVADEGGVSAAGLESMERADAWSRGTAARALSILALAALALWSIKKALGS
jgi:hypothetical protein